VAVRAIEYVKKTVAVGMQEELSIQPAKFRVDQDVGLGSIPVVYIVGSELVMPLHFSSVRVQSQHAIRI